VSKKDPNYVVKVEKAIAEKYGDETIQNPRGSWSEEKEKKYLEGMKRFYEKTTSARKESERREHKGFLISTALLNRKSERDCPVCEKYSFEKKDDLYMIKFNCCWMCYIEHVEGREDRWKEGWRPDNTRAIIK